MGGGVPRGGPPNQAAYFVALVSILFLMLLLCCYFCYFFVSKVKELSKQEELSPTPPAAAPRPTSYPVQPVVREGATAMAALCKQIPTGAPSGRGGTVFPAATSPAAQQTDMSGTHLPAPPPAPTDKLLTTPMLPRPCPVDAS